ncbi:hypothetical protein [Schinkia azotoformans]|uniref:hypothetical protein n=1 Tax=Schinkia azotoformans TaxID=1454 RepID=UPI002DB7CDAC|nr:hypothetical protein [Schinkia azotoformans]MEC1780077.1 hypothetical protein [Schinkia azotoformans]MED4330844.1 hypothetical protein [Schinkia azotoformans]
MAGKIVDFDVLFNDPLVFKNLHGKDYTIPFDVGTEFTLKLKNQYYNKIGDAKDDEESLLLLQNIVLEILKLDTNQQTKLSDVKKFGAKTLAIIFHETMKHINTIEQNPNSNTPES